MKKDLKQIVKQTKSLAKSGDSKKLSTFLDSLDISVVEDLIDELPHYAPLFITTLSINRAANVFRILDVPTQERITEKLPDSKISELLDALPPDDQTAFIGEVDDDLRPQLMSLLSKEDQVEVSELLSYPEDSVGRLMTPDYLAVNKNMTVSDVLDFIRKNGKNSETIDVIYILDDKGVLLDDLRIRELLIAPPDTLIENLMDERLIYLDADAPQEDAIKIFKMNNRVALPVIDKNRILLGIVTIDDVLWIADEEYSEDMQRIGGTGALDEPYLDVSVFHLVWKRAGWLIVLFIGELLTASVMQSYFVRHLILRVVYTAKTN